jgi:hypothetical protein
METSIIFNKVTKLSHALSIIEGKSNLSKNLTVFILLDIHLILSFCLEDFTWLAAFGGLLTTLSLLLIFSQNSLSEHQSDYTDLYIGREQDFICDGGVSFGDLVPESRKKQILNQRKETYKSKYQNLNYYFWYTVSGTLIWSYASFLNFIWK